MKRGLLLFAGVVLAISAYSQEKQLTFTEAISIGLNENFIMKNTRNDLRYFKSDKSFQVSSFTPNLGVSAGISQTSGPQVDAEGGFVNSVSDNFRGTIGANLTLYNGNSRIHSLKSSSSRLAGQEYLVTRTEQDVMNQIALQFLQVLLDQELLSIAKENLESQQHTLEQISGFVTAGTRAEVDRYRQEADVKSFELTVIQANNTLTRDKAALAQTLQLDPSEEFVVVRPEWNIDQIRMMSPDLNELYTMALASRADYKRLGSVEEAAYHNYKGAFNGYLPFLSGFVNYGSTYFNASGQPSDPFLTQIENRRSLSYGLNLTIPIWDRLQTKNNRVFNKVNYENAQNELENGEKTVKLQVQTAYYNFQDVRVGYEVSLAQYDAAKLAYDTQQESYSVGLATQVELAVANASFVSAQSNLASTGYRLLFQKILLDYAVGVLTMESIPK